MFFSKFFCKFLFAGELSIRVNHHLKTLTFDANLFSQQKGSISEGPKLQAVPSEQMRTQLSRLAARLSTALHQINPSLRSAFDEERTQRLRTIAANMTSERERALARKSMIERRKEIEEALAMTKEQEEMRERAARAQMEAEAEKQRLAEEARKRELQRLHREREEIERQQAQKLAEELARKNVKIDVEVSNQYGYKTFIVINCRVPYV